MKNKKIIYVFASILATIATIALSVFIFNQIQYHGWRTVEIPTEGEYRSTIKLPEEWDFTCEDGRLYIKDTNGNTIATEIFEGQRINYNRGKQHFDNKDELDINPALSYPFSDVDCYELARMHDNGSRLRSITVDGVVSYALYMPIYSMEGYEGVYALLMLFNDTTVDESTLIKIQRSYNWAGHFK